MPDQFGNPTPQEAMQAIIAQRQQAISQARTPSERRLTNLYFMGQAMGQGMDPRVTKATEIQDALSSSQQLKRREGESGLDYQIRQGRAAMESMRNVDPTTFAQISEQITQLESERLDRNLLLSREAREEARFEQDQALGEQKIAEGQRELDFNNLTYLYNPDTQQLEGEALDRTDTSYAERLQQAMQGTRLLPLSRDEVVDVLDTTAADVSYFNNSGLDARITKINDELRFVDNATQLADVFGRVFVEGEGNPAAQVIGTLNRGVGSILNNLTEGSRILDSRGQQVVLPSYGSAEYERDAKDIEERMKQDQDMLRWVNQNNIPFAEAASLMTSLAYTLARTYDNRVTDADFRNAWKMLGGGSNDPGTIMASLRSQALSQTRSLTEEVGTELNSIISSYPAGSEAVLDAKVLRNQLDLLEGKAQTFQTRSQEVMDVFGQVDTFTPAGHRVPDETQEALDPNRVVTDHGAFTIR